MKKCEIGVLGLGVMGSSLAENFIRNGFQTALYSRESFERERFYQRGLSGFVMTDSFESFVAALERPRRIVMMITAGPAVDAVKDSLAPYLEEGDILVDGGNSYFEDTNRRTEEYAKLGLHFTGMGVSGGERGALEGPSMMVAGSEEAWRELVGEEPQWTAYYPATVGMAAATVMDFWNWLPRALHYSRPREDALALNFSCIRFQQLAPFLAEVLSAREQHHALELLEEYAAGGPVAVKWHRAERSSQEVDFQLLLDEIGVGLVQRMAVLAEKLSMQRHAALMAWKVIDFQRRTGRFPRDLQEAGASEQEAEDFGYAAIVASTDHAPGFRIFAREGGEVKVEHGIFVEYPPELSSH